ncbi:ImpA family metalloprotease [Photobacterium sp. GSS17]|uniref:ImpA family metalloprotease n=1 Tax=Photobacterium sp. GSS17 TaxID=3020715 RepID=UPI002361DF29|nr:ImpA family metalloprotease [Photobacterium sp. GSS17]
MQLRLAIKQLLLLGALTPLAACGGGGGDEPVTTDKETGGIVQNGNESENQGDIQPETPSEPETTPDPDTTPEPSYLISVKVSDKVTITPELVKAKAGERYTFDVAVDEGYKLNGIAGCNGQWQPDSQQYVTGAIAGDCEIPPSLTSLVEQAISQEDHTLASADALIEYSLDQLKLATARQASLIPQFYQGVGDTISWHPTHDSITFTSFLPESNVEVLRSTQNEAGRPSAKGLIYAGEQNGHRYMAMAGNMFSVDRNAQTDTLLNNLVVWLTRRNEMTTEPLKVITSHVSSRADSWYFPHNENIRKWLNEFYPNNHTINTPNSCEYEALSACIDTQQPDMIIFSDIDRDGRGYAGVAAAIEKAKQRQIPIIVVNHERFASPMASPLYSYMGLAGEGNYWSEHHAANASVEEQKSLPATLRAVSELLPRLEQGAFDISVLDSCNKNFLYCDDVAFNQAFKTAADWYRQSVSAMDSYGLDAFSKDEFRLISAGLLLADKYRASIDYPIDQSEQGAWQQAMFADWVVSYKRAHNLAQPDLGEFVTDKSQVVKGANAHYRYPAVVNTQRTFSVPYTKQWTTTGWYALPGQTITLTRQDNSSATASIKLNYHRSNTNRAYQQKVYRGPLELAQQRLSIAAGETVTFSTPYGGPVYLYLEGSASPVSVTIAAQGVAQHPTIMDFSDPHEIARFNDTLNTTELPHVDLRTDGAEQHLRRDRFLDALGGQMPTVDDLLKAIEEDHLNAVYTLAGYKVQGKTLEQSLPVDVRMNCEALFGRDDCYDTKMHTRTIIQHANYDQNAHCGSGCSGNPWDAAWEIDPTGWGDNHELGHNLQTKRLNVHYVTEGNRDTWSEYGSRAGENSNNIFPYFVKWKTHYERDGQSTTITDGHMNHKDLFYVFMSDAAGVTNTQGERVVVDSRCQVMDSGADRFTVPWQSNDYAVHNGYRMAFYIQMALRLDKQLLTGGARLDNGFHVFTLLYQHSRIFGQFAGNENDWLANRERLGFSLFPYSGHLTYGNKTVQEIPGNDFMLVALSQLTDQDWRPYFDMFGLRYSSLAASQVALNAKSGAVTPGMYVLETDLPSAGMSADLEFLPLNITDGTTRWPRDLSSPTQCQL